MLYLDITRGVGIVLPGTSVAGCCCAILHSKITSERSPNEYQAYRTCVSVVTAMSAGLGFIETVTNAAPGPLPNSSDHLLSDKVITP